jgi:DNA relaxase NicK
MTTPRSHKGGTSELPPPPTNRGAVMTSSPGGDHASDGTNALAVSLHWLTATTKVLTISDCVSIAAEYLGSSVEVHERGAFGYTCTHELFGGLKLLSNEKRPEMGVCLYASGEVCEVLGFERLSWLYQAMHMTATRADLAIDNCPFSPGQLRWHWQRDNVRTNCKPMKGALESRVHVRTCNWHSSPDGDTFYMGSRSSTQFARCYNSRGFTRFEIELKKERAAEVMEMLNRGASMDEVALGVVREFVDFIHREDDVRPDRCRLQGFWQRFIDGFARIKTYVEPRPQRSFERVVNFIEHQVARTLALYEDLLLQEARHTGEYGAHIPSIREMIRLRLRDLGKSRYDDSDRLLLQMHRAVLAQFRQH